MPAAITRDMQQTLPWFIALASLAFLAAAIAMWLLRDRRRRPPPLPTEWTLTARPVFSTDERRVYRQLREALPHHIVLSKLPLVRFCQPTDPQEVRFWYDLLGGIHVTFAICSANGRVLAAIDLESDRAASRRIQQIKQSVLAACRVRYLRCPVDHLPSVPELQLLVPHSVAAARGPQPAPGIPAAGAAASAAGPARRRERATLWQDSGFFQDSFFGPESRSDTSPASEFGAAARAPAPSAARDLDERPPPGNDSPGDEVSRPPPPTRH